MKWLLFIAYSVLLTLGYVLMMTPQPQAVVWRAARTLERNHLLLPGDIAYEGSGSYLTRQVKENEPFGPKDLAPKPDLTVPAGQIAFNIPLDMAQVRGENINAGVQVRLCQAAATVAEALTPRAVLCSAGGSCMAVVAVAADKAPELAKALGQKTPVTIKLMKTPCN